MTNYIHKTVKDTDYYVMPNELAQNRELSFEARGMLAYIMSQAENWRVQPKDLEQQCGKNRVYRILNDLIAAGYIQREAERDANQRIINWHYHVSDEPLPQNLEVGFPEQENRDVIKERIVKKKEKNVAPMGQQTPAPVSDPTPPAKTTYDPDAPGIDITPITREQWEQLTPREQEIWPVTEPQAGDYRNARGALADLGDGEPAEVSIRRLRDSQPLAEQPLTPGNNLDGELCPACKRPKSEHDKCEIHYGSPKNKSCKYCGELETHINHSCLLSYRPLTPDDIAHAHKLAQEHGLDDDLATVDSMFAAMGYRRAEPQLPIGDDDDTDLIDERIQLAPKQSVKVAGEIGEVRKGEPGSSAMLGIDELDDSWVMAHTLQCEKCQNITFADDSLTATWRCEKCGAIYDKSTCELSTLHVSLDVDPLANKNVNGSVPIMADICLECGHKKRTLRDANNNVYLVCNCTTEAMMIEQGWQEFSSPKSYDECYNPPKSAIYPTKIKLPEFTRKEQPVIPNDNPNLSHLQKSLLSIAGGDVKYINASFARSEVKSACLDLGGRGLLLQTCDKWQITDTGSQWVKDNPGDYDKFIPGLAIRPKVKPRAKRKGEPKLPPTELRPEIYDIGTAFIAFRHPKHTYKTLTDGSKWGIIKFCETIRHEDWIDDFPILMEYFEHEDKKDPGFNWRDKLYKTYVKPEHIQNALDWKKSAPAHAGNDGIRLAHIVGDTDDN